MESTSYATRMLWAKKASDSSHFRLRWLPLVTHMQDASFVALKLCRDWLSPGVRATLADQLGGLDTLERLASFLGAAHDIGKATPVFQAKTAQAGFGHGVSSDLDDLILDNLKMARIPIELRGYFSHASASPHALATQLLLERRGCHRNIAVILGSHHGKPPNYGHLTKQKIESYPDNYHLEQRGKLIWTKMQDHLIDFALQLGGFVSLDELPIPDMTCQVLLSGLVIMADWISSNEMLFPLFDLSQYPSYEPNPLRNEKAWTRLNFSDIWMSSPSSVGSDYFHKRFGFSANRLQKTAIEVANRIQSPGIMVIEAPMGGGKTEAALAVAEIFAEKFCRTGVFFALPTQATSDGMFPRMLQWINHLDDGFHAVRLAHSKAQFNDRYRALFEGASNIEGEEDGSAFVHGWFEGQKKSLLADFVIGTVDQLLLAALKQKHVMLRHLGLSGKVVIIDECHAYDAYMNQYLERAIQWLGAYGVPVVLLSATLPENRRHALMKAYWGNSTTEPMTNGNVKMCRSSDHEYPIISYFDGKDFHQQIIAFDGVKKIVSIRPIADGAIADVLKRLLENGGCAGIVVNTVKRAQGIATDLCDIFGVQAVRLLHSRFLATDRIRKEKELMSELGAPSDQTLRPDLRIVVGTQVFEQSLDIDFDVLISDLCPMDLLLQRIGRMHRHKRNRPDRLVKPICYVLGADDDDFDRGSCLIYSKYLLMRTQALLPERIMIPEDLSRLVQLTYEGDTPLDPEPQDYKKAKDAWVHCVKDQTRRAQSYRIKSPSRDLDDNIVELLETDIKASEQHAEAAVRDTNSTFDVLAIRRLESGDFVLLSEESGRELLECRFDAHKTPGDSNARLLAQQSIRLPLALCIPGKTIDETIRQLEEENLSTLSAWQESPWLRGELFLIFNDQREAYLNGYKLAYDSNKGLTHEKMETRDE